MIGLPDDYKLLEDWKAEDNASQRALFERMIQKPQEYQWVKEAAGKIADSKNEGRWVFKGEQQSAAYWTASITKSLNDFHKGIIEPLQTAAIAIDLLLAMTRLTQRIRDDYFYFINKHSRLIANE
jgi:hypothetical protein